MISPLSKLRRPAALTALAAAALAAGATPAFAAPGYSLDISGPGAGAVGKPSLFKVSGTNPTPAESWFSTYMQVEAIPASVMPACPPAYLEGIQIAEHSWASGGDHIAGPQTELRDDAGNWTASVAYTPSVPGRMLLCGYSQNVTNTLAMDQHVIQVAATARASRKCKKPKRGSASVAKRRCKKRR
jgi:hypothetical protein